MIYFIYVPTGNLQKLSESRAAAVVQEIRMTLIHELESAGHSPRYTWFDSSWWTTESMKSRGIMNTDLHLFAKNIEELSKCNGIYFGGTLADLESDYVGRSLYRIATDYGFDIRFFDDSAIINKYCKNL